MDALQRNGARVLVTVSPTGLRRVAGWRGQVREGSILEKEGGQGDRDSVVPQPVSCLSPC